MDPGSALGQSAQIGIENGVGWLQIAAFQRIVKGVAVFLEAGDVAGQEIGTAEIEIIEIGGQHQRRQPIIQLALPVMMPGQQFRNSLIQRNQFRSGRQSLNNSVWSRIRRFGQRSAQAQQQGQRQQEFQELDVRHNAVSTETSLDAPPDSDPAQTMIGTG